jgi:methionine synthase / methylenetetrahydrofolate reductase(NADPH)
VVAGAELIETNTFGANPIWLKRFGLAEQTREINFNGAKLAREVAGDWVAVAGSIGPLGLKTGEEIPPEAAAGYQEQAVALAEGGADLFMLETFLELEELALAIRAVKQAVPELPVVASLSMLEKGRTARGVTIEDACRRAYELGADVFGTNCGKGPRHLIDAVEHLVRSGKVDESRTILAAYPNAGFPEYVNGRYMYVTTPEYMADAARRLAAAGVSLIGGCCGTTPTDIAAIKGALSRNKKRTPLRDARERLQRESPAPPAGEKGPARAKKAKAPGEAFAKAGIPPAVPPGEVEFIKRARARLQSGAGAGAPPVLVEIDAPKDLDVDRGLRGAKLLLKEGVDAITVGDSPLAVMRMSNLAFADLLQRETGLLQRETGRPVIAHLSCRDRNLIGTQSELMGMYALGVHNVLAITGDPASIGNQPGATSVYDLNSFGLIEVMARMNKGENIVGEPLAGHTSFTIGAAFNPNGRRIDDQLRRLKRKVELGAHFVMTQPCFDIERIRELYKRAGPLGVPIFLGILPLTSHRAAEFLHNEVPGIEVPDRVRARLAGLDKDAAKAMGQEIAREVIDATFDLAHGFYIIPPFNMAKHAVELVRFVREKTPVARSS